jgi:L-seryl-tRNA(Ser) seleniumtransferase
MFVLNARRELRGFEKTFILSGMNIPSQNTEALLRSLPAVQRILEEPGVQDLQKRYGREAVANAARETLAALREDILNGQVGSNGSGATLASMSAVQQAVISRVERLGGGVKRVINGTGVILHTGLGRAVLPPAAMNAITDELAGYAAVEVDVDSGKRGHRDASTRELLKNLLGCEHATVVNKNAAATMLALAAVARGKEVIVSRGQLVEIGGSFRVPDVMRESGCRLVEVGTTNRTYVRDYEAAITPETAALLIVHTSNFRIVGFTEEPSVRALVELGRKHNIPVIHDIGSGALLPGLAPELASEPVVKVSLDDGADLVLFSADKILGGPQGGIAVGKTEWVERMRRHPLYRAFRIDKLTLCALETTLRLYLDVERRYETVPTLKMLRKTIEDLRNEADALAQALKRANSALEIQCCDDSSRLGSGSLPEQNIPTRVVSVRHKEFGAEQLGSFLRAHTPPIFTRIQDERVLIDPRTLQAGEAEEIARAVAGLV